MNVAPGQSHLSLFVFSEQKRYKPLGDGLVPAADHAAHLSAEVPQATDAQARKLEARRIAAAVPQQ